MSRNDNGSGIGIGPYDPANDLYEALGVRPTATDVEIRKAHRTLIRERHPDHGGNARHAATLNIARDVLLDPAKRRRYDELRGRFICELFQIPFSGPAGPAVDQRGAQAEDHGNARTRPAHAQPPPGPTPTATPTNAPPRAPRSTLMFEVAIGEAWAAFGVGDWRAALGVLAASLVVDKLIDFTWANDRIRPTVTI